MNKSFYIPKEKRKKLLLITDDIRVHSGVATVGREIVSHTAHHYNWVCIAGAINHPEKGKRFDLSQSINETYGIDDASVFLYPADGYGEPNLLRTIINLEKPDAIFLITDPRYFTWLFQMENEIRKKIPIIYLNIWDDYPAPQYNEAFYESCDALLGISKQTHNINKLVLGNKGKNKVMRYVPHGLNPDIYFPITEVTPEFEEFKNKMFSGREFDFVVVFNSRNIRRKQIPDTMLAFKYFLDTLPKEKAAKCALLLHTEVVFEHGTDLNEVRNYLLSDYKDNVIFSTQPLNTKQMNFLYNLGDAQILLTSNEGWGLSLTEAMLAGRPIIANVTGGMQDQMNFKNGNGEWVDFDENFPSNNRGTVKRCGAWAFPVFPSNISLQGSPGTPYIWDDRCRPEDAAKQMEKLYKMGSEKRKKAGEKGREFALNEGGFTSEIQAARVMEGVDEMFSKWQPREKFEIINATLHQSKTLSHKLLY
jgi:glycosyltransferase involved in cell wall biosynthesis